MDFCEFRVSVVYIVSFRAARERAWTLSRVILLKHGIQLSLKFKTYFFQIKRNHKRIFMQSLFINPGKDEPVEKNRPKYFTKE